MMSECPHCGTERDASGVGPPCCVAGLIAGEQETWSSGLEFVVPDGSDPAEVRWWLGGRSSGFVFMQDGEEIILGGPPGCHIVLSGLPVMGSPDWDPEQEGEWACTYDGVLLARGTVKLRIVDASGQDGCAMHYGKPCQ